MGITGKIGLPTISAKVGQIDLTKKAVDRVQCHPLIGF